MSNWTAARDAALAGIRALLNEEQTFLPFRDVEREELAEILAEVEAAIIEAVTAPPEKVARLQRTFEAQLLGLIEIGRLTALNAQRTGIVLFIRGVIATARALLRFP